MVRLLFSLTMQVYPEGQRSRDMSIMPTTLTLTLLPMMYLRKADHIERIDGINRTSPGST